MGLQTSPTLRNPVGGRDPHWKNNCALIQQVGRTSPNFSLYRVDDGNTATYSPSIISGKK